MFHRHRMIHIFPTNRGKRAAGLWLWSHIDRFIAKPLCCELFQNKCPVQVLTALYRQQNATRLQHRHDPGIYSFRSFHAGTFADFLTDNLAGGAADDQQITGTKASNIYQFCDSLLRLQCNLL